MAICAFAQKGYTEGEQEVPTSNQFRNRWAKKTTVLKKESK